MVSLPESQLRLQHGGREAGQLSKVQRRPVLGNRSLLVSMLVSLRYPTSADSIFSWQKRESSYPSREDLAKPCLRGEHFSSTSRGQDPVTCMKESGIEENPVLLLIIGSCASKGASRWNCTCPQGLENGLSWEASRWCMKTRGTGNRLCQTQWQFFLRNLWPF